MVAAQSTDLGDYFQFAVQRTEALDNQLEGVAVRYRVDASLAGRRFEYVVVDVGFGAPFPREPDLLSGTGLLEFAKVQSPLVPTIPLTQHVAEKVHAYTRSYGQAGRPSTRVKDLVDLVLICTHEAFEAAALWRALETAFGARDTHALPQTLPAPPADWRVPYAKLARDVSIDHDVVDGHHLVSKFLDPVLSQVVPDESIWDPDSTKWLPARS